MPDALSRQTLLRMIPSVDKLLERDDVAALLNRHSRAMVVRAVQKQLAILRKAIVTAPDVKMEEAFRPGSTLTQIMACTVFR